MSEPDATPVEPLRFGVLGPLEVTRGGALVKVGGGKAKAILAMLVLEANRVVSTSRLIDGVWGEDPPTGVQATLQVHVSNLRKALGPTSVVTRSPGYVLEVAAGDVDLTCFETELEQARGALGRGDLVEAEALLSTALGRWRGSALSDVLDAPFTTSTVPWLMERRALAAEEHAEALLSMGRHREAIADLEAAVADAPHRERLWCQLMIALYRSGRQAEALAAYQRARSVLGEDLGIDPGPELRRLESAILAQDPVLDLPEATVPAAPALPDGMDPGETFRAVVQTNCRLVLENGEELLLEGPVTIGRHPDCGVALPDAGVSRRHAEIRPALGGYLLLDLGSTNGTLVNDAPVVQHVLFDGDVIRVGAHHLRYRSDGS